MTSGSPSRRAMSSRSSGVILRNVSRADSGCMSTTLSEPVLPAFLPGEVLGYEVFKRHAGEEVVQAPSGGDVPDDQHPLSVPAQRQVIEEAPDARDGLAPAFTARIDPVKVVAPVGVQLGHRHPVALPVVTLAQPPVEQHR